VPQRRAFRAGRQIAALSIAARVTKPDRHDGDPAFVIKAVAIESKPTAQPIAAPIVER
jgi:hypothetical protein